MANIPFKMITLPSRSDADTLLSINLYSNQPSANTLIGNITVAENVAGKTLLVSDGSTHDITAKGVYQTSGENAIATDIIQIDLSSAQTFAFNTLDADNNSLSVASFASKGNADFVIPFNLGSLPSANQFIAGCNLGGSTNANQITPYYVGGELQMRVRNNTAVLFNSDDNGQHTLLVNNDYELRRVGLRFSIWNVQGTPIEVAFIVITGTCTIASALVWGGLNIASGAGMNMQTNNFAVDNKTFIPAAQNTLTVLPAAEGGDTALVTTSGTLANSFVQL